MPIDTNGLKNSVDIVALVGSYVELKRRGSEYVGLCVNHDDHSPSMWVNPEKRFVHCFSCGFNADAIAFVQYMEHCDFKEAAEKLGATEWKPKRITSESKPKPSAGKPPLSSICRMRDWKPSSMVALAVWERQRPKPVLETPPSR